MAGAGKIHPGRLLLTLKVLLAPSGGIKSPAEVSFILVNIWGDTVFFSGWQTRPFNGKVLQETGFQDNLPKRVAQLLYWASGAVSGKEGMEPPGIVVRFSNQFCIQHSILKD